MLAAILLVIFALHAPWLSKPPYEYDGWRQSDTEAIALSIADSGFGSLYPQLNYDGPPPNIVQLEPPVTPLLIALLYGAFGQQYALARLVPLLFFLGSTVYVYRIGLRLLPSAAAALTAALVYGLLPVNLLYARAIMPEAGALFFTTGAFFYFLVWRCGRETPDGQRQLELAPLIASAVCTALAVSQKIPAVFIGIPLLVIALECFRLAVWRRIELWLFAVAALVPPYLYYRHMGAVAEFRFVDGIAAKHIFPRMWSDFASGEAQRFFVEELPLAFTWWGLLLFAIGLLAAVFSWRQRYPLIVWALAFLAEFLLIVAVIRFPYYMIFLGPPLALLVAYALSLLWRSSSGVVLSALLVAALSVQSVALVLPHWRSSQPELLRQAAIVRELTQPDDLIVVGTDDPSLLNATRRKGWRVGNTLPQDPLKELELFVQGGASYFVPLKGYIHGDDGTLRRLLEQRYPKLEPVPGYPVFKLR